MDGDKPILAANRNCHKLSPVSLALAQISCSFQFCLRARPAGFLSCGCTLQLPTSNLMMLPLLGVTEDLREKS